MRSGIELNQFPSIFLPTLSNILVCQKSRQYTDVRLVYMESIYVHFVCIEVKEMSGTLTNHFNLSRVGWKTHRN